MSKIVIKRDGTQEPFMTERIVKAMQEVIAPLHLADPFVPMFKIIKNFEMKLPDQVTTEEIDKLLLKAIEGLISEDPLYDDIATSQLAMIINEGVNKRFKSFREYLTYGVAEGLLHSALLEFDVDALELSFNYEYDKELNYFGLHTLHDRYLVKDRKQQVIEKPQWMWMRVAMGLSLYETNKEEFALSLYKKFAQLKYIHSTPTLYNAGTPTNQLSSCYINVVDDSIESIMAKGTETAYFAKYAGGVGTSLTKLRASGSHIQSLNAKSSGPIPFIKIYDTIVNSIFQGGRRRASQVIYMEPRHYNFEEFLDLKETNGNEYVRTRSLNTACRLPDEFMQRVVEDKDRYLVDPKECVELTETWGESFSEHYAKVIEKAEKGELKLFKKIRAQELYRKILIAAAKTGNYWLTFKDRHNEFNQAAAYSPIHSSNLCTEISIANNEQSTAVCTLASINLARVVHEDLRKKSDISSMSLTQKYNLINWDELKQTIDLAIRALDNVLDINFYPSPEAKKNSLDLRPLGLGVMGFGELLVRLGIAYDSKDALELSDQLGAFVYTSALAQSKLLAEEKGAFADWDAERYPYEARRNALLLAIAPTASISNICGTSSGIESYFANVYSRETLSGKYTIIVRQLIDQLKEKGLWNEEMKARIVASGGSIQSFTDLEEHIDLSLFKTVYETSPYAQVDVAAVRQKHIDQAISRNMYMKENLRDQLFDIYVYAWKAGLKSTYYCFIEKTIQGEKYTQQVNKRGERRGFGTGGGTPLRITTGETSATPTVENSSTGQALGRTAQVAALAEVAATTVAQTADADLTKIDLTTLTDADKEAIETKLREEKGDEYVDQLKAGTLYDGACPIDPFEKVMCTSCQ